MSASARLFRSFSVQGQYLRSSSGGDSMEIVGSGGLGVVQEQNQNTF